jgi:DNA polymerase I
MRNWNYQHVESLEPVKKMFLHERPLLAGFDTETTGLHLKRDKPFLIQFGWMGDTKQVYTFYPTPMNMKYFFEICQASRMMIGHNVKYDLHMLANIGFPVEDTQIQWVENMVLARLSLEAIPERLGGDSLALKSLAKKYVHPDCGKSEQLIKDNLSRLKKERIKILSVALKQFKLPDSNKSWGMGVIKDFLKDPTNDVDDLPLDVRNVWVNWNEQYPEPTYEDIDRELMLKYGGEDVAMMLEFAAKALPIIKRREQMEILKQETDAIMPFWRMERTGFCMDLEYLESCRLKMKNYIQHMRNHLYNLLGERVNVGQHERLKQIFKSKWNITMEKMDNAALKRLEQEEVKDAVKTIQELRTLEKWYSTYILRLQSGSEYDGRYYSQLNLASAVSGRIGSDFQQFPKKPIKDREGQELFHPRKVVKVTPNYQSIYYLDYSQIELRAQANYTLLVSGGDVNLCRAYFPFRCTSKETGETYDWKNPDHKARWNSGEWLDEEGKPWTKTDVHSLTTHNTLLELGYKPVTKHEQYQYTKEDEPFFGQLDTEKDFEMVRYKGKTFNFMANYGGGLGAAMDTLNLPKQIAYALLNGYAASFPEVKSYQEAIVTAYQQKGYVRNMLGRRYYLYSENARRAYTLANYCIQGSCADDMKDAITKIDKYMQDNQLQSRLVIPIHDELQIECVRGEEHHMDIILKMMEDNADWYYVPVVCDMEKTETNWASKEKVQSVTMIS